MPARDELEAALAASFDRAHLAVYGDYLMSIGDPRGELIAIDLQGGDEGRKRELVEQWLGATLAACVDRAGSVEFGFLVVKIGEHTELAFRLLTGASAWVRRLVFEHVTHELQVTSGLLDILMSVVESTPLSWLNAIDASRREPGDVIIARLPDFARTLKLTSVRLPSVRRDAGVEALARALVDMPDAEVEVARMYVTQMPTRAFPTRVRVPRPFPWLPREQVGGVRVRVPGVEDSIGASILEVEDRAAELDAEELATWAELFAFAASTDRTRDVPARALLRAFESIHSYHLDDLRAALERRGDNLVTLGKPRRR
jgi:hypothetical protein